MGDSAVEIAGLVREYRLGAQTVRALDGIDLTIEAGQFVSIVGQSGAGKSTLLHILGALDVPDEGSVSVDGNDITRLTEREQSEFRLHRVGFIFQFFNLQPTLSAWENVAVPKLLSGVTTRRAKPDAMRLLDSVGLGHRADHRPSELSGGQMQRVAVARSLIMKPPLILADEPSGNLDSSTGAEIIGLLTDLAHDAADRRTVVMVTHNADAAESTDRIITIRDGRIADNKSLTGQVPN
ncbi:ABC transporter ATP-binding protein [Nocardia sp. BMG51109]|uniref:ABC transporter ATP-binding protein n=1 Tax=Nocardia sp. BMG51109 TaxID=1056816 RepID=UPI00055C6EDF|nr:ABC transporter ATP-binding protein [Nocardia sp. BMG51109]